jgi:hypothetical protein
LRCSPKLLSLFVWMIPSQDTPFVPKYAPLLPSSTPYAQSVMTGQCQHVRSRFPSDEAGP